VSKKPVTGMLAYIIAGREIRCKNAHTKCLLLYYCCNVGKTGSFFKSMLDIHTETGLAESTIRELNGRFKQMGFLSWVAGSNLQKRANTYTLDLDKMQSLAEATLTFHNANKNRIRQQWAERARRYRRKRSASRREATVATADRHAGSAA